MSFNILKCEDDRFESELNHLLWRVLWEPLGLPRDIQNEFGLTGQALRLVATTGGQVVGGVVFYKLSETDAELRHIAIHSAHQRLGIGKQLVQHGLTLLAREGHSAVYTVARNTSLGFFLKLGFVPLLDQVQDHPVFSRHGISFRKLVFRLSRETG